MVTGSRTSRSPKSVWAELMEAGRIVPHSVFPDAQGPAARWITDQDDVRDVIALLRLNYDRQVRAATAFRPARSASQRSTSRPARAPS